MTFLSASTALLFAAIAVPLLLLLYFLKLRRQPHVISSTFLWKKAIEDLRVNAPFQKLRKNLLLFLQLLILGAILFAIADPIANFVRTPERNIVLMLDRSASMRTKEADGRTRLEHAQEAAAEFVATLPDASRAMVLSFADSPNVVCTFTDDKRRLARLIREIEPTDGASRIGEALPLAIAYSTNLVEVAGDAGYNVPDAAMEGAADIEFFSDGRIADAGEQYVTRGNMRYYRIGEAVDNVGIVAMDVSRDWDQPGMLSVFVQVENFGPAAITTDLSLSLDGKALPGPGAIREITLGPATAATTQPGTIVTASKTTDTRPSSQNVIFSFHHDAGGIVEARIHREDVFEVDNRVQSPVDPPRRIRVLAVTDRSYVQFFIAKALTALGVEDVKTMTPDEYEKADDKTLISEGRLAYDLAVLDLHSTNRVPPGNYLFLGGLPKIDGVSAAEVVEGQPLVFAREDHPLMRNLNYEAVFIAKWKKLSLPRHAVSLMEGKDSAVMAMLTDPGHRYVISAFDVLESNFAMKEAWPIFLQNVIGHLAAGGLVDAGKRLAPGDTIESTAPPGATLARIERPDAEVDEIEVRPGTPVTYARTRQVGTYRVRFNDSRKTVESFAVNLLDRNESCIAPNDAFRVGAESIQMVSAEQKVNEPLWPYAAGLALVVLVLEWWIYTRRVMI